MESQGRVQRSKSPTRSGTTADPMVEAEKPQADAQRPPPEISTAVQSSSTEADDAKGLEARRIALERLKLGSDANWPDEKEILNSILQKVRGPDDTALEFSIRNAAERIQTRGNAAREPTEHAIGIVMEAYPGNDGDENGLNGYGNINQIQIYSEALQSLVRETVTFYPALDRYQIPLTLERPFDVLFHFSEELMRNSRTKELLPKDRDGIRALDYICAKKLLYFSKARTSFANGRTTEDFLRYLYRPGTLLYAKDNLEAPQIVMCLGHSFKQVKRPGSEDSDVSVVRAWCVVWSWEFKRFERELVAFATARFQGDRDIKSLPIYPLNYYGDETEVNRLKYEVVQRSRKWAKLVSQKPSCWLYEGTCKQWIAQYGLWIFDQGHARLIVDGKRRVVEVGNFKAALVVDDSVRDWDNRPRYQTYDNIKSASSFTEDQLLLCVSMIEGRDPKTNTYRMVSVNSLRPIIWNKAVLDQLVLPQEKKDLLVRVIQERLSDAPGVSSDIIEGKGQGLVVLLHGPPGVGKTLTAESVAEHLERILMHLPIRDLVSNEHAVDKLSHRLEEAERLGAILLLDEADVILEKRSLEDVRRNGLVSSFLRTLEYFRGIIIMTTNRASTIDLAFQSRIHHAIEFPHTSVSTRRKIWTMFIKRLSDADTTEDLLEHVDELKKFNLNGRQIRNTQRVAKALAGGQRLTFAHLKQAVEEAFETSRYFGNEADATRSKLRVSLKGKSVPRSSHKTNEDDEDDEDD